MCSSGRGGGGVSANIEICSKIPQGRHPLTIEGDGALEASGGWRVLADAPVVPHVRHNAWQFRC